MEDIFVARVMSPDVVTVSPDTLVEDAAETMLEHDIGSLVVLDEAGELEGILTSTDFVRIVAKSQPKAQTPVETYMTRDVVTTSSQVSIRDVADAMVEHGFHHVPVVDEVEGVVGMVTSSDLTGYLSHVQSPSPSE